MTLREKAQARVVKWKKALKKGHEIAKMTGVNETIISRLYSGNGHVTETACKKVLEYKP